MTTATQTSPETAAMLRNLASMKLRRALNHFVETFKATPDDKLDLKLSETANSPRELVAHVIGGNQHVGSCMNVEMPAPAEALTREELIEQLVSTTNAIIDRIDSMPDADFDTEVSFFANEIPMPMFVFLDEWHLSRHAGQLDYLQTMWGDMENRF